MTKKTIKKHTLVSAVIVAAWLVITLQVLGIFGIHSGWPAFLVLLFFIEGGGKTEKLKSIFSGGAVGLLMAFGLTLGVEWIAPAVGLSLGINLMVFLAVFLLIALGDLSHTLFNNYAFCYFTVALISTVQHTATWLGVLFLGGTFFVGGVIQLTKLYHKMAHKNQAAKTDMGKQHA